MHSNLHILTFFQNLNQCLIVACVFHLFYSLRFFSPQLSIKCRAPEVSQFVYQCYELVLKNWNGGNQEEKCRSWATFGWLKPKTWLDQSEKEPPLSCISLRLCCQHWLNPKEFLFIILTIPNTLLYPSCVHPLVAKYISSKMRRTKYKDYIFIPHMCRCSFQWISLSVPHDSGWFFFLFNSWRADDMSRRSEFRAVCSRHPSSGRKGVFNTVERNLATAVFNLVFIIKWWVMWFVFANIWLRVIEVQILIFIFFCISEVPPHLSRVI